MKIYKRSVFTNPNLLSQMARILFDQKRQIKCVIGVSWETRCNLSSLSCISLKPHLNLYTRTSNDEENRKALKDIPPTTRSIEIARDAFPKTGNRGVFVLDMATLISELGIFMALAANINRCGRDSGIAWLLRPLSVLMWPRVENPSLYPSLPTALSLAPGESIEGWMIWVKIVSSQLTFPTRAHNRIQFTQQVTGEDSIGSVQW